MSEGADPSHAVVPAVDDILHAIGTDLSDFELRWRTRQQFLQSKGYMLRPRYHEDWVPSWTNNGKDPDDCEDFHPLPVRPNLVDATRMVDGRLVYIKRVRTGSTELEIATMLSDDSKHAMNHSVPTLETFVDSDEPSISYMVMPYLRYTDDPPFTYVNDIVDFVDQMLEGLVYMHSKGVAHRDCTWKNLMMDASSLYPHGFHPVQTDYLPDALHRAKFIQRLSAWPPVKYYYVDFGISVLIPPEVQPRHVVGGYGIDREVPELSFTRPYDPFKVDVFIVGNVFRRRIYAKFANIEFLERLATSMTAHNPKERPTADEALKCWRKIRGGVGFVTRGTLLRDRADGDKDPIFFDFTAFLKLGMLLSRRILNWAMHLLAVLHRRN